MQKAPAQSSSPARSSWPPRTAEPPDSCSRHQRHGRTARPADQTASFVVCQTSQPLRNLKRLARNTGRCDNSRLTPVHRIKRLIQEQANRPTRVHPSRAVLIHVRRIVQHRQDIGDHEAEPGESDLHLLISIVYHFVIRLRFVGTWLTALGAMPIGKSSMTWLHQYGLST